MSRVTRLRNKRETLSPSKFLRAYGAEPGLILQKAILIRCSVNNSKHSDNTNNTNNTAENSF